MRERKNRKQENAFGAFDGRSGVARTARGDLVASLPGIRCRSRERRALVVTTASRFGIDRTTACGRLGNQLRVSIGPPEFDFAADRTVFVGRCIYKYRRTSDEEFLNTTLE